MTKTLIFSEEYVKITKGMFVVWTNYAREAAKTRQVAILLNREHWAFAEAEGAARSGQQVVVQRLPFDMPSTWLRRVLSAQRRPFAIRAPVYALGQTLNFTLSPLIILYLYARLRQIRPQAVFSHNGGWPAGPLWRWIMYAARLAQVPKRILVIHNYPRKETSILESLLVAPLRFCSAQLVGRCATSIVTVSDSVKAVLEYEVFRRPVIRIHNGIDVSALEGRSERCATALQWDPAGLVVGFVGALYPRKGAHVLIEAFRSVQTPCELALLGPGVGPPQYLSSLRERAGLCANKVSFLGFHDDVDKFMQRIDLLVVPSIAFESFGMVVLEAMRHRKPVICSDFGGMKEIVENGVTGLVVPAGDAPALSKAMERLLASSDARHRMGEAGYRRLNAAFTAARMAEQYDSLVTR